MTFLALSALATAALPRASFFRIGERLSFTARGTVVGLTSEELAMPI